MRGFTLRFMPRALTYLEACGTQTSSVPRTSIS